jgi:hypothetical protein
MDVGGCRGSAHLPAVVRYDEVVRGMVEHAMRFTVKYVQGVWVYPARHRGMNPTGPDEGPRRR